MFDKKTIALFVGLIALIVFLFFLSRTTNLKEFFQFGQFTATPSARTTFSDIILPSPTP